MAISDGLGAIAGGIQLFGGAAADVLAAGGKFSERDAYLGAAEYALKARDFTLQQKDEVRKNIDVEQASTRIQLAANAIRTEQQQRELFRVIGSQRAAVAASGLSAGGSALDVIRSSASEGRLDTALLKAQGGLISKQGEINQRAYAAQLLGLDAQAVAVEGQARAYVGQAWSAESAAHALQAGAAGKSGGGLLNVIGGIFKIFGL